MAEIIILEFLYLHLAGFKWLNSLQLLVKSRVWNMMLTRIWLGLCMLPGQISVKQSQFYFCAVTCSELHRYSWHQKKLIEQKNVWLFEYKIIYLIYDWNLRTLIIHNNMYNIWIHCNFCFHFNCSFNFSSGVIFFIYLSYLYAYIDLFILFMF